MKKYCTFNKKVAIAPLKSEKLDPKVVGGFATISQKRDVIIAPIVFDFFDEEKRIEWRSPNISIVIRGDSAFRPWNKEIYTLNDKDFVLCPFEEIIGVSFDD
jgi:hypothetical protein